MLASMYPFFSLSRPSKYLSDMTFSSGVMSHCGAGDALKGVNRLNVLGPGTAADRGGILGAGPLPVSWDCNPPVYWG